MSIELVFTPSGHLNAGESTEREPDGPGKGLLKAFDAGRAQGLLALATEKFDDPPTPAMDYWREFAGRYLTELCHTPQAADAEQELLADTRLTVAAVERARQVAVRLVVLVHVGIE